MKRRTTWAAFAALGGMLLAAMASAQSEPFRFFGPLARVITPNGDGVNDVAIFCFDNPADSDISGRIYTMLGSEVAVLGARAPRPAACPVGALANSGQYMSWDGHSEGGTVRSGLYFYRLQAENRVYTGTLLVVR